MMVINASARRRSSLPTIRSTVLYLEDKRCGLAVHYGPAPQLKDEVHGTVMAACRNLGPEFTLEAGPYSLEVSPASCTTAKAISLFMQQTPFAQRTPVFIGNDPTHESGFDVVNELGGLSVKVGAAESTAARYRLSCVAEVVGWLESVAAH